MREQIDVPQVYFPDSTHSGVLARRLAGVKAVVRTRNNVNHWMTPTHRRLGRLLNWFVTATVCSSQAARGAVLADERPDPAVVIVPPAGQGLRCPGPAAVVVVRSHPDGDFHVSGEGPQCPELKQLIADLGLNHRFVLVAFRRNLDDFLPHLDLLVQSQLTRGMPNVVPEASAAGVPVVATGVGGTPEISVEGCSRYLVPAGDSPLLAQPTLKVMEDEQRGRMGDAGREFRQAQFTFAVQGQRYFELL